MKRLLRIAPFAALVLLGLAVYYPVTHFDFVNYDDSSYVSRNIHALRGINSEDLAWAWTTTRMGQWHPITWWSFQLDSQLFGPSPSGFHFSNLLIHLAGTCLLYASLRMLKLEAGFSFFVAALFCLHPLHVESVAWISERKGILSSVFWFSGMLAYAWYTLNPRWYRMSLVVLAMALGLMTKQMLVTFPFALLLLDIWPLKRLHLPNGLNFSMPLRGHKSELSQAKTAGETISLGQAMLEKSPLFVLAITFCVIAVFTQSKEGAVNSLEGISLQTRLLNVPGTYLFTLLHAFWPFALCVIYLPPQNLVARAVAGSFVLILLTYLAIRCRTSLPAVLIGWLWFLGTLFPLSGIVPLGAQWTADRYTDIPLVGIYLAVAQLALFASSRYKIPRSYVCGAAIAILLIFSAISIGQLDSWRDRGSLMECALEVNPNNPVALLNLGAYLIEKGDFGSAREHLLKAIRLAPNDLKSKANLGLVYFKLGQNELAVEQFQSVLDQDPTLAESYLNLGNCFRSTDRGKALKYFQEAVRLDPENAEAHNNLGALLATSDPPTAKAHYERSIAIWPDNSDAHCNLANLYARSGQWERAINEYEQALSINKNHTIAQQNLQVVLRSQRNSEQQAVPKP